jgi:hypothetical protein
MQIWKQRARTITWLIVAVVLAACGNGGKPGY